MDVLITPAAGLEIEALKVLRPDPSSWGVLVGHKRGSRFIVERVVLSGTSRRPGETDLAGLEAIWPGRVIGLLAARPDRELRKAALGPAWYGKLVLVAAGPVKAPALRPFVVEYDRRFFLKPVPLAPGPKEEADE